MPLRVLLTSDHPAVRESLRSLLEATPGMDVIVALADRADCLGQAATCVPDVVVIDGVPGSATERLVSILHQAHPETAIIVLAMHADCSHIQAALGAGARGYLLKETAAREMGAALRAVTAGQIYLGAHLA